MSFRNRSKSEQQTVLRAIVFAVSAGLVVVLTSVTVSLSVLVAAVSAKHTILAKETSSMAKTRMLVGVMLLDVVCGDAAAIKLWFTPNNSGECPSLLYARI
jgi:anti-sigma factor RsiW